VSLHRRKLLWSGAAGVAAALTIAGAYLLLPLPLPLPALDRNEKLSALVLARDGSVLRGFLSADGKWRLPVKPEAVDPLYREMLIAAEDRRFSSHPGVDPIAAARAVGQLVSERRVVSGASTLTMQTVRLLEKRPRTFAAKLIEMAEAVNLERRLGKDEILGLYMTLAPFGGNLEGVRAASLAYFGKEPSRLSAAEAALLVAIPRSPERLRPDRHPEAARHARDAVLARMPAQSVISETLMAEAREEAVPVQRAALPLHAPHLAHALREGTSGREPLRTTIDPALQRKLEVLLRHEAAALDPQATLAALVVDNRTRAVLAYVGNADFGAAERHGTLDMARAVRSPGSALKPFIYALAFDRLLLHPETVLDDSPRHFGEYAPSDFDGRFQGEVSAADALRYSLNVPAVAVLDRLGPSRFTAALASGGIRLHLPVSAAQEPGLAIALGGAGISLTDLTALYAALAQGGEVTPLRYREDDPPSRGTALVGPAAAWYVTDILENAPAPPGMLPGEVRRGRRLAMKTGTSYGFRDAWEAGYDAEVTIAVWAGRPDGTPMPGHTGRTTAAPVLFKIADLLGPGSPNTINPPPGVLARRDLPSGLRRLDPFPVLANRGPKILYPPDGATVAWDGGELPLEASGGQGPLRWLVDGRPLPPTTPRRAFNWRPAGVGFAQLTVIDTAGRSARATVRLVQ